jgi:hypothetical protein
MFKNLRLSTKLYAGFAIVIVLTAILGLVCWRSTSQLRTQMTTYTDWGTIDMVMNEGVSQKILLLDNAFGAFRADPGQGTAAQLQDAVDAATEGIQEWAELMKGDSGLAKVADEVSAHINMYKQVVTEYQSSVDAQQQIRTKWDAIVADILTLLETTMEEVIDPAKAAAEEKQDIAQTTRWGNIDMIMNEAVISGALKAQTAAHDYGAAPSEEHWQEFQTSTQAAVDGLVEWAGLIAGETELEQVALKIESYLTNFTEEGANLQTQNAANAEESASASEELSAQAGFDEFNG